MVIIITYFDCRSLHRPRSEFRRCQNIKTENITNINTADTLCMPHSNTQIGTHYIENLPLFLLLGCHRDAVEDLNYVSCPLVSLSPMRCKTSEKTNLNKSNSRRHTHLRAESHYKMLSQVQELRRFGC